jgi:hypothetical protein
VSKTSDGADAADAAAPASRVDDPGAVLTELAAGGLLLLSDPKRNNAITVLTGEFPKGSWWSHRDANRIYATLQTVEDHPDVLSAKLISGKVTFVHRDLWPALRAVVTAREPWQLEDLSPGAVQFLAALDRADAEGVPVTPPVSRTVGKEIEARLLARAESVHTSAGKHETRLESWSVWAARAKCPPPLPLDAAKARLEAAAARLGPPAGSLPWQG